MHHTQVKSAALAATDSCLTTLAGECSGWAFTAAPAWRGAGGERWLSSGGVKGPPVLLVHPRSQSPAAVEEALRLVASFAGGALGYQDECPGLSSSSPLGRESGCGGGGRNAAFHCQLCRWDFKVSNCRAQGLALKPYSAGFVSVVPMGCCVWRLASPVASECVGTSSAPGLSVSSISSKALDRRRRFASCSARQAEAGQGFKPLSIDALASRFGINSSIIGVVGI